MPPWLVFPHLEPAHIGWKMAPGEDYLWKWGAIFTTLTQAEKEAYFSKYDLGPEWPYRQQWYDGWVFGCDD